MKYRKIGFVIVTLLLVTVLLTAVMPVSGAAPETVRVWVTYQSGRKAEVFQALERVNANLHYDFPELEAYVVSLPVSALNGILRNPFVIGVEEDPERYPIEPVKLDLEAEEAGDPYTEQVTPWGIEAVQAPEVWSGPDQLTGEGVTVCIIDTGYYADHEDLRDDVDGMSQVDDNFARDGYGHGSHVAGTIGALDNDIGVIGVSPGVDFHIVKIFSDDGTWVNRASDLTAAIYDCRDNGAKVISMSLSGSRPNKPEERAFDQLYNAGILHVAAAGNHQVETPGALHYPASYASVISVGAVDSNLEVADFSAQNAPLELAAPGVNVLSTVPFIDQTTITVDGVVYNGFLIEFAPRTAATGVLVDGGKCLTSGDWAGAVVLCERGDASFYDKTLNVQNGGGVAAVIYNNVPGDFFGTLGTLLDIISISLSQDTGQYLVANKLGLEATVDSIFTQFASGYEAWNGTSMATPHVAGVAALIWSANLTWSNVQIREAMKETTIDLGAEGRDVAYGYGLVQAAEALEYLEGSPPPPQDEQLVVEFTSPADGTQFADREIVLITVKVTDGTVPVQGAAVTVVIESPQFKPQTLNGTTDVDGEVSFTYRINANRSGKGQYTLTATAAKDGFQDGTAERMFTVN